MSEPNVRYTLSCTFTITPQGVKPSEEELHRLIQQAANEALQAKREHDQISATPQFPGGFGGLGEIAVAFHLALPYLKEIGTHLADGALDTAGAYFFTQYLAPQLRKLNLLPSKFRIEPRKAETEAAAHQTSAKKPARKKPNARAKRKSSGGSGKGRRS